ncbi:hypothetical protein KY285_005444 [Solanum tuberosum]|nr:hypothetical protein KY284_005655 [Solanum tuberosum]KAH0752296.1 hypothetical protein KY285_005444 [Solanum tuberosum]
MLEEIRVKVMRREIAHGCKVEFNGDFGYEVTEGLGTYREYPPPHAIKAMLYDKDNTQGASSSSRNCKKKCNDTTSTPRIHHSVGTEEDLLLRPMVVYEVTRLEERKKKPKPTIGSRRIRFTGDASGVSLPINLSYSPTKTIWKGRAATTLHQLQNERKKKRLKMMVRKGQGIPDNDDNDVNF